MTDSPPPDGEPRVWYASYGSNLRWERFRFYLTGGWIEGRDRGHHGSRDPSHPIADRSWRIPHRLHFGGVSRRWGGGVAFVDPRRGSGESVVRLWNLTHQQFEDVAAQENGLTPGEVEVDLRRLEERGALDIGGPWYGHGLWCGRVDGMPVVTFTQRELFDPNPPTPAYLEMVAGGLLEVGLDHHSAAEYLMEASGMEPEWDHRRITELVGHLPSSGARPH
ncbi:MAG TPA: histone deacetylase [Acidimicrobiales bacterium]|nr:histone deacetylase [Acidimicrobiales bacterium]